MATTIGIGFSSLTPPSAAVQDATAQIKKQTSLNRCGLVLLLATPSHADCPVNNILSALQPDKLIGSIVPGIILPHSIESKGLAILSLTSDEIITAVTLEQANPQTPVQNMALTFSRSLGLSLGQAKRQGALIFLDDPRANLSPFIHGFQEGLGKAFSFTGAINSGGLFCQDRLWQQAVAGVIFGGQTIFSSACSHGWQPLGKPRTADQTNGNIIKTIDGQPAIDIYREYFPEEFPGSYPTHLGNIGLLYPLGLNTATPKSYLIKSPTAVLPNGSLVCQSEVPPGAQLHLMIGDKDACRKASRDAASSMREMLHFKAPKLIIPAISVARKKLFGRSAWQEINTIKEILGFTSPLFGMYTYGEIGTAGNTSGVLDTQVHNASVVLTAIG